VLKIRDLDNKASLRDFSSFNNFLISKKAIKLAFVILNLTIISLFSFNLSPRASYADNPIITLLSGNNPYGIAVNPNTNTIYVTNNGSSTISI
jgi:hypothetical protein